MKKAIVISIVLLAAMLRLYKLGSVPAGLHRDEAFLGYNAFSLLTTGREITGETWPIHLRSFLYSPAGYAYAAIPSVAAFGLTSFAVRLPSALAGILTVIGVYVLVFAVQKEQRVSGLAYPLLSSFLLAVSPWHINLSRTATENTIVVLILTVATYLFLTYVQKGKFVHFAASILLFASTYCFYQAPRAFVPLLVPLLLLYGWRRIRTPERLRVIVVTAVFIFVPVIGIMASPTLSTRIRTVSIFASKETQLTIDESRREDSIAGVNPIIARLYHNKAIAYTKAVMDNYFHHFSYDFLLKDKGFPDRYRVPGMGLMYPWELLLAIIGAGVLLWKSPGLSTLLLGWIALAPLGSALTSDDVPNMQRTLIMFPALSIVTAYGLLWAVIKLRTYRWFLPLSGVLIITAFYGFSSYVHAYYVQQLYHRPWYRHEGYEQLVREVNKQLPQFTKAVITNHESSPMIFFLFYNRTDPEVIQRVWQRDKSADLNTLPFGNYEFSKETCPVHLETSTQTPALIGEPGILYANFSECKVNDPRVREISRIRRLDNTEVFTLLEVLP